MKKFSQFIIEAEQLDEFVDTSKRRRQKQKQKSKTKQANGKGGGKGRAGRGSSTSRGSRTGRNPRTGKIAGQSPSTKPGAGVSSPSSTDVRRAPTVPKTKPATTNVGGRFMELIKKANPGQLINIGRNMVSGANPYAVAASVIASDIKNRSVADGTMTPDKPGYVGDTTKAPTPGQITKQPGPMPAYTPPATQKDVDPETEMGKELDSLSNTTTTPGGSGPGIGTGVGIGAGLLGGLGNRNNPKDPSDNKTPRRKPRPGPKQPPGRRITGFKPPQLPGLPKISSAGGPAPSISGKVSGIKPYISQI